MHRSRETTRIAKPSESTSVSSTTRRGRRARGRQTSSKSWSTWPWPAQPCVRFDLSTAFSTSTSSSTPGSSAQQPESAGASAVSTAQLDGLLTHRSTGLIEKMRRNTWFEVLFSVGVVAVTLFYLLVWSAEAIFQVAGAVLVLLAVGLLYHYRLQLRLLRRMTHAEAHVRAHLETLCAGLRQLLRFYYRLTLASLPLALLIDLGFFVSKALGDLL